MENGKGICQVAGEYFSNFIGSGGFPTTSEHVRQPPSYTQTLSGPSLDWGNIILFGWRQMATN